MRIVAFDVGDKRIGVAVSDPFNEYAIPSDTYFRTGNFEEDVSRIVQLAEREAATVIVCGLPLNADGTESVQTKKTMRFIEALRRATSVPVETEDERYTTREARHDLVSVGVSCKKDKAKKNIDSIAAAYILEGYLAKIKQGEKIMSMKEESNDYENDENIVVLEDEDGKTARYEHVGTIEYKGEWYCFFTPETAAEESEGEDDENDVEEVAVFRLVGEEDDERLEIVEDDDLLDEVFEEFCRLYDEEDDEEEE